MERPASRLLRFAEGMLSITKGMEHVEGWDQLLCIRIGIHTGPAIAAVMGEKSFKFTFIGDTVRHSTELPSLSALAKRLASRSHCASANMR